MNNKNDNKIMRLEQSHAEEYVANSKISRRELIVGIPMVAASISLVSCTTQIQSDYALYCSSDQKLLNPHMCRQLDIRKRQLIELSLAVLIGAAVGSVIGLAAGGRPGVGALIGAAAGGSLSIAKSYLELKIEQSKGDTQLALEYVKKDIKQDIEYLNFTIQDIKHGVEQIDTVIENKMQKLSKRVGAFEKMKIIENNSRKNIGVFSEAENGYNITLDSNTLEKDHNSVELMTELNKKKNKAVGAYLILRDRHEKIQ